MGEREREGVLRDGKRVSERERERERWTSVLLSASIIALLRVLYVHVLRYVWYRTFSISCLK